MIYQRQLKPKKGSTACLQAPAVSTYVAGFLRYFEPFLLLAEADDREEVLSVAVGTGLNHNRQ